MERGVAYCSQFRVYPTRRFLRHVREGRLPEILRSCPEELEGLVKMLARRPAGIPFEELGEINAT